MPVKVFSAVDAAGVETKINEWMVKLEPGSVRQISAGQAGAQVVVTVWYTETKDKN